MRFSEKPGKLAIKFSMAKKNDEKRKETKIQIMKYRQKNRERDIRNFFMGTSQGRDIENSQFSTPGASSAHLKEYQIDMSKPLGQGNFAIVFKAFHKVTGFPVAIKVYEKFRLLDTQLKQNLIREVKILYKLTQMPQNNHIMKLHEAIDTLDKIYLVVEFLESPSLAKYLQTNKLNENDCLKIIK